MATLDPFFDTKNSYHYRTRALGMMKQPLQRDGYVNNTIRTTNNELDHRESIEVKPRVYTPYANKKTLSAMRKLKTISKDDEW